MANVTKFRHEFEAIVRIDLNNGTPFDAKVSGTQTAASMDIVESTLELEYQEKRDGVLLHLKITQFKEEGGLGVTRYIDYGNSGKLVSKPEPAPPQVIGKPSVKPPLKAAEKEPCDWMWLGACKGVQEILKCEEHVVPQPYTYKATN